MSLKPFVLTISRNRRNRELLSHFLNKHGHRTLSVDTLERVEQAIEQVMTFQFALIDVEGFGRRLWTCCDKLTNRGIPLCVIYPQRFQMLQHAPQLGGTVNVLYKPLAVTELNNLIHSLMRHVPHE